jgi:hypothetical protein
MTPNVDFKFRDDLVRTPTETVPIELLMSPFDGVIFRYDKVQITEQDDHAKMKFEYTILEKKDFDEEKLRANKTFNHTLGIVLNHMILEFCEHSNEDK